MNFSRYSFVGYKRLLNIVRLQTILSENFQIPDFLFLFIHSFVKTNRDNFVGSVESSCKKKERNIYTGIFM